MNKAVIGWIVAGLMLFGCLGMAAGAIVLGVMWNQTSTELATANQTLADTTQELQDTRTELNGRIATLTADRDTYKGLYTDTICEKTWTFTYSSYNELQDGINAFVRALPVVSNMNRNNLTYGYLDFKKVWFVDVNYTKTGGGTSGLIFFAFPDDKATFFGNQACWLDPVVD